MFKAYRGRSGRFLQNLAALACNFIAGLGSRPPALEGDSFVFYGCGIRLGISVYCFDCCGFHLHGSQALRCRNIFGVTCESVSSRGVSGVEECTPEAHQTLENRVDVDLYGCRKSASSKKTADEHNGHRASSRMIGNPCKSCIWLRSEVIRAYALSLWECSFQISESR